ncbi:MAG: hypothetical protein ACP6IU_05375 [Candidatus Asgardarchaeia archaeon]
MNMIKKRDIYVIVGIALIVIAIYDFLITPVAPSTILGISALIVLGILIIIIGIETKALMKTAPKEAPQITEMKDASRGRRAVREIKPESYFEVYKPTKIHMRVRNTTGAKGMRLYFTSVDYTNPNNIILWIDPEQEQDIYIRVIPVGQGERDLAIEVRPLFDENGNLIPESEADPVSFQSFSYKVKERMVGGLTSTQRSLLKNVAKIAALATVVSGALFAYFPELATSADILTSFVPLIVTLQIPLLYFYFYLRNKLPIG